MPVIQSVITIVLFFLVLGLLVLVHELGHFLTARAAKVRVLEFGIGFPPRSRVLGEGAVDPQDDEWDRRTREETIASLRAHNPDALEKFLDQEPERTKGTLYTLNWLPIGGFVKLEGEDGNAADDPRSFSAQGLPKKLVILVAGVVMNVVLAFAIFTSIAWLATPYVGVRFHEVQPGSPADQSGLVPGDAIVAVDGVRYEFFGNESVLDGLRGRAGERVVLTIDHADGFLTVRAIKKSIDGALGSRGAWLLEPYSDMPGATGHNTATVEEIRGTAKLALAHGYQLAVHAIGDRANRETLDLFEEAFKGRDGKALRWRVEHAQHLHPDDIPRFGRLGVIASMQGVHCTSDAPYVPARLGPRRAEEGAYVWQKLMMTGAVVTNGTDAPVEDVSPIASYYASVSRRVPDGSVFYPEQRMGRLEALRSYTINGAYAAFDEESRGSLKVGKYADLVVLSKDILTIPEQEIPSTATRYTVVGGKVRYRR